MKSKFLLAGIAMLLLCSFAGYDILTEAKLTKEQLSDRLVKELSDESAGSFLQVHINQFTTFGLNVTLADFKSIATATYQPKLMEMKAQITVAMQSPYFQKQWDAYLVSQGIPKINTKHDLAAAQVRREQPSVASVTTPVSGITEELENTIRSKNDELTDLNNQLKEKGNPPGRIKTNNDDKQKAIVKLAAAKEAYAKKDGDEAAYKNAYLIWKHTEEILEEIENVDNELNSIAIDISTWSAGVGADHKKEVLASKQDYTAKRAVFQQILDKKKVSNTAFNDAYMDWRWTALINEKMERITDADVKRVKDMANPNLHLKAVLQQFLIRSNGIDFNAAVLKNHFVNKDYEGKTNEWKFYFRRGAAFTNAARSITAQWIAELK